MKIVQTFWSNAYLDRMSLGYNSGWPERKFLYMSWGLSCLLLKKLYSRVELITDEEGKEILVDLLGFPYDHVTVGLNGLNRYDPNLWCLSKVYAYSLQHEPFLHVDGDLFLFERPGKEAGNASVLVAGERWFSERIFLQFVDYIESVAKRRSGNFKKEEKKEIEARGYNIGIFGGSDILTLSAYANWFLAFWDENLDLINREVNFMTGELPPALMRGDEHPIYEVNAIIESYFLRTFAGHCGARVTSVREGPVAPYGDMPYRQPGPGKKKLAICRQLEHVLRNDFPDHYYHILTAIKECRI